MILISFMTKSWSILLVLTMISLTFGFQKDIMFQKQNVQSMTYKSSSMNNNAWFKHSKCSYLLASSKPIDANMETIEIIQSLDDFSEFVAKDENLCIIKFRASWCKTCQKFDHKFQKWANEVYLDDTKEVRFADVEYGTNRQLCRSLGIKRLPYIQMYKGSHGRVDEFVCTPKKFQILVDKMEEFVILEDDVEQRMKTKAEVEHSVFDSILEAGSNLIEKYMNDIQKELRN